MLACSHDPQDCWALLDRDSHTKEQIPDPIKFPKGIKALAHEIHSLGLKIGIYRRVRPFLDAFRSLNIDIVTPGL